MARPKILIVEDDPLVLVTAAESLRDAGFVVIEADTADVAASILRAIADEVAVVFTDIEMPGEMNGISLARVVSEVWPAISVILTSGRIKPSSHELPPRATFLPKPYDVFHVATLIVELVES